MLSLDCGLRFYCTWKPHRPATPVTPVTSPLQGVGVGSSLGAWGELWPGVLWTRLAYLDSNFLACPLQTGFWSFLSIPFPALPLPLSHPLLPGLTLTSPVFADVTEPLLAPECRPTSQPDVTVSMRFREACADA